ncbi:MAG: Gmad2 immunoglobulin-like domain-containing protein [Bacillota bacterium]
MDLAVYYVKFNNNDEYLVREIHRVPYTDNGPEAALNELIKTNPVTKDAARILPPDTKILGIEINEGRAVVNFSSEVLKASVGSLSEALGIQSIVNTLTEFPQIREVSFMVDGKNDSRTMDWWGHVGLYEQPFRRNLEKVIEPAIWVTHPVEDQAVGVPLLVKGSAMVFEGRVSARLLDENGKKLASGNCTASRGAPGRGDFEIQMTFTPPGKGNGVLEVYSASPKDGSDINMVRIPVKLP